MEAPDPLDGKPEAGESAIGPPSRAAGLHNEPPTPRVTIGGRLKRRRAERARREQKPTRWSCCQGERPFQPAPSRMSTTDQSHAPPIRPPRRDDDHFCWRRRPKNQNRQSLSFPGEAFSLRQIGRSGDRAGKTRKRTPFRPPGLVQLLTNDS